MFHVKHSGETQIEINFLKSLPLLKFKPFIKNFWINIFNKIKKKIFYIGSQIFFRSF